MEEKNKSSKKRTAYRYIALFLVGIFLLFFAAHSTLAAAPRLELTYPTIPGFGSSISNNPSLGEIITYLFELAVISAGVLGMISIVIAGITMLASAGNPSAISDARERIFGSILGIILLLCSFILLQTINPELVSLKPTLLVKSAGVWVIRPVTTYNHDTAPFGISVATAATPANPLSGYEFVIAAPSPGDLSKLALTGNESLFNYCPGGVGEKVVVNTVSSGGTKDTEGLECYDDGQDQAAFDKAIMPLAGIASWYYESLKPGIYLFAKTGCFDGDSDSRVSDIDNSFGFSFITQDQPLPPWLQGQVKSAAFVNGPTKDKYGNPTNEPFYAFVLSGINGTENCSQPYKSSVPQSATEITTDCVTIVPDTTCQIEPPPPPTSKCVLGTGGVNTGVCSTTGTGADCTSNSDCPTQPPPTFCKPSTQTCETAANGGTGAACSSNSQCQTTCTTSSPFQCKIGGGGPSCTSDSQCGPTCNSSNQCVTGGGGASCSTNADCTATFTLIVSKVVVNTGCTTGCKQPSDFILTIDGTPAGSFPNGGGVIQKVLPVAGSPHAVSEINTDPSHYTATYTNCSISSPVPGYAYNCTITNTYSSSTATLTIRKVVNGAPAGVGGSNPTDWQLSAGSSSFDTSWGVTGSSTVTNRSVPVGTYTLRESGGFTSYLLAWSCTGGTFASPDKITLTAGQSATCTATNTYNKGILTLVKTVSGNGTGTPQSWTLTASGATTISGTSGSVQVTSQPVSPGNYTLSESGGPSGYTAGNWSCSGGTLSGSTLTVAAGQTITCTINNNFGNSTATLTLAKTVNNIGCTTNCAQPGAWTLTASGPTTISGTSGSAAVTNKSVNAGTYTLSESGGPAGYTAANWSCSGGSLSGSTLTITAGQTVACNITNNYNATNTHLSCVNQACVSVSGAGANTCTTNANCSATATHLTCVNQACVSVNGTGVNTCATNANCTGGTALLTLIKSVGNAGCTANCAGPNSWTLSASGPTPLSGFSGTSGNVSAGTYVLSESAGPAGYTSSPYVCSINNGPNIVGNTITLATGNSAVCTITNTYVPPGFTLTMNLVNPSGGGVTMPISPSVEQNIPSGFSRLITATPSAGFTFSSFTVTGGCPTTSLTSSPMVITMTADCSVTANFTASGPGQPTATITANPLSIPLGQPTAITWSSTNANGCTATQSAPQGGAWAGPRGISGTVSVTPTAIGTYTYTIVCTGSGGTSSPASIAVTVNNTGGGNAPTATISANPPSLSAPGTTNLAWSSTNATSCAPGAGTPQWANSGSKPPSGTMTNVNVTVTTTFTITCSGTGGTSPQASVTVTVGGGSTPPPTVSLLANGVKSTNIAVGGSATLTWSTTNATSCIASSSPSSAQWSGGKAVNNSVGQLVSPSTSTMYTLNCTGPGGSGVDSANVNVQTGTPTIGSLPIHATLASFLITQNSAALSNIILTPTAIPHTSASLTATGTTCPSTQSYIHIIYINNGADGSLASGDFGSGVDFYAGTKFLALPQSQIKQQWTYLGDINKKVCAEGSLQTGRGQPQNTCAASNLPPAIQHIDTKGYYTSVVYVENQLGNNRKCYVLDGQMFFYRDTNDATKKADPLMVQNDVVIFGDNDESYRMDIFPTQP